MTHVVLDLSKQRLFIHPDAPLPRFNPRPKAVMVTPVYDYDGYIKTPVERGRSQDRDTIFTNAFNAAQHVISNQPQRPGKLNRRYSSHSPSRRYSESPGGYSDDRYSTYSYIAPEVGFGQGVSTDRARPPDHHLAQKPPSYQIQATQGHAQSQQYGYSYPSSNRPTHSQYQQSYAPAPIIQAPSHGGTHNTGGGGRKSRPSNHHLVQNPPQHQTQATQAAQIYGPAQPPPAAVSMSHSHSGGPIRPGRLDKLILEYFKIIPPNPEWCLSRCSGRKRAVCIGINYIGQRDALKGCANDARHMRDFLIQHHNFPPSEILLLTDDDQRNKLPTHKSIFEACMWLVNGAKRDDSLFFHYSGHGGQSPDAEGRETDGMDEVIFPLDHSADPSKPLDIIDDVTLLLTPFITPLTSS
ncbi:hypothetical protein FA15DRAFT_627780 [Coprinopsis marcescibilis]|uniref:Peptidase C14 caspase domain-containing protein n=1 Tax=Coprinopsis marcescibilis TaxID=230819 RepID=A0A5C3KFS3_COPMA|nr:hypothetical protein FA15DRAFT_627780 [Coprinopsis marcescibilis]